MWHFKPYLENIAAIRETGEQITYKELSNQSQELKKRIPKRSLVFSLCKNTLGSLVGYVGFLENKIVPLLLDSHLDDELLTHLIAVYQPGYLWILKEQERNLRKK